MRVCIVIMTSVIIYYSTEIPCSYAQDSLRFSLAGEYPADRALSRDGADSELANGIATDGNRWFYATESTIYRLSNDFRHTDRSAKIRGGDVDGTTCDHIGGIDFFDGELYAALERCADGVARILVLNEDLLKLRTALIPEVNNSLPWVAVNPRDAHLYVVSNHPDPQQNAKTLLRFKRRFRNGEVISSVTSVRFRDNPGDYLEHFWTQGGSFSSNGLFFRTVDDAKDEYSEFTGVWVYELSWPLLSGSATARRVGFISIKYDPDIWAPTCLPFRECVRSFELEDLDGTRMPSGRARGDVHVLMLDNQLDEDAVTLYHFRASDHDQDGVIDTEDNCIWKANAGQYDFDRDGAGFACDSDDGAVTLSAVQMLLN